MSELSAQIRQALAELELVSHAPIQGYNFAPSENGRGDRWRKSDHKAPIPHLGQHSQKGGDSSIPRGSDVEHPDRHDPLELDAWRTSYHRRTIGYFLVQLEERGESPVILAEIRETTKAWRVMQVPKGQPPDYGTAQWKRYIFESKEDSGVLATRFNCTRRYINMVRQAEGILVREAFEAEERRREKAA